ncbi:hypothetical protein Patl1_30248 [Pistacia atlantica]|uniref:Uncharacterized protein n=1 Tax=Pistacia atlantica TaxID=434234 RepID=A0ACC1ADN9_9ROSI|nr:hypothetical protein Patl1_30248 [Pistacia atlantica]
MDPPPSDSTLPLHSDDDQRVYLVPYRWWKDAQESTFDSDGKRGILYTATPGPSSAGPMKIINNIFNSDLLFNLRREEDSSQNGENGEVGVLRTGLCIGPWGNVVAGTQMVSLCC